MTVTYGLDGSNNNPGLSLKAAAKQGFGFAMWKLSEGTGFHDLTFDAARAEAKEAGLLFAAYHALHRGNAVAQADFACSHLADKSIPLMIDFEPFGDNPLQADALAFARQCRKNGVRVTLNYHPHWYWQQIGSPGLARLPHLVSSAYPSSAHAHASELYPGDNSEGWQPYGGRTPTIWQFSSTARVDGYSGNVDVNAFRGTRDELAALGLFKDFSAGKPHPKPHPHPKPKPRKGPDHSKWYWFPGFWRHLFAYKKRSKK